MSGNTSKKPEMLEHPWPVVWMPNKNTIIPDRF